MDGLLAFKLGRPDLYGSTGAPPVTPTQADLFAVSASARVPDLIGRMGLGMLLTAVIGVTTFYTLTHNHQR